MIDAHITLLKAELAVMGREIGIVVGLAVAAVVLAVLIMVLLYVGTLLFLGEWLLGSIGWGLLDGVLLTLAFIVPIGLDLAGGRVSAWGRGFLIGLVLTIGLAALFASNVVRTGAVSAGEQLESGLALEPALLPTLVGMAAGAMVLGIALMIAGLRVTRPIGLLVLGALTGAAIGAVLGSVTFDTRGAFAVALTIGLVTWIVATGLIAVRRGFDPQGRYGRILPRASIDAFGDSRDFVEQQLRRQRSRLMGR